MGECSALLLVNVQNLLQKATKYINGWPFCGDLVGCTRLLVVQNHRLDGIKSSMVATDAHFQFGLANYRMIMFSLNPPLQ